MFTVDDEKDSGPFEDRSFLEDDLPLDADIPLDADSLKDSLGSGYPNRRDLELFLRASDQFPTEENLESQKREMVRLCEMVAELTPEGWPVETLEVSETDHLFVIGDIHSDYPTFRKLARKILCNPCVDHRNTHLVFLGDYLDRGDKPFQVLRLLLRLKLAWPGHVHLLRGNHDQLIEDQEGKIRSGCNRPTETVDSWMDIYGEEVFRKLKLCLDSFPVACVGDCSTWTVEDEKRPRFLFVHGGIPRDTDMEEFEAKQVPVSERLASDEYGQAFLWSDPEDKDQVIQPPDKRRFSFGRESFQRFKELHGFTHLVRSHEPVRDGVEEHEGFGTLITVFSTGGVDNPHSNYNGQVTNPSFLHINSIIKGFWAPVRIYTDRVRFVCKDRDKAGDGRSAVRGFCEKLAAMIEDDAVKVGLYDYEENHESGDGTESLIPGSFVDIPFLAFSEDEEGNIAGMLVFQNKNSNNVFEVKPISKYPKESETLLEDWHRIVTNAYPLLKKVEIEEQEDERQEEQGNGKDDGYPSPRLVIEN